MNSKTTWIWFVLHSSFLISSDVVASLAGITRSGEEGVFSARSPVHTGTPSDVFVLSCNRCLSMRTAREP